ncbi:MAG: hypothetical protein VB034_10325 [Eubacteriales bacterium]|nr:hypothetical protein [Eubacteriales bacterium]
MKKLFAALLALAFMFAGVLSGCTQKKEISIGAGGTISSAGESGEASTPTPEPTAAPTPTEAPTPTPTEAPGWFYHYNRVLIDQENVRFTLQTMEYNFDAKTLTVIADYENTGKYNQIVVFVNVLVKDASLTLYAETGDENNRMISVLSGEKRTVTFAIDLSDEDLTQTDLQHLSTVSIDLAKFEATDKSKPDSYTVGTFDAVEVELPPTA